MNKLVISSVVAVLVMTSIITEGEAFVLGDCYEEWSRCSGWSSAATGLLWKSCQNRCVELGHRTGTCVLVDSRCLSDKAYQCQCSD